MDKTVTKKGIIGVFLAMILAVSLFAGYFTPIEKAYAVEDYHTWCQMDERWADMPIGYSDMASIGCYVTSIAVVAAASGARDTEYFNPGVFLQGLNDIGAFSADGSLTSWASISAVIPEVGIYGGYRWFSSYSREGKIAEMQNWLDQGFYILCNVGGHWVYVDSICDGTVYMVDPAQTGNSMFDCYADCYINSYEVFTGLNPYGSAANYYSTAEENNYSEDAFDYSEDEYYYSEDDYDYSEDEYYYSEDDYDYSEDEYYYSEDDYDYSEDEYYSEEYEETTAAEEIITTDEVPSAVETTVITETTTAEITTTLTETTAAATEAASTSTETTTEAVTTLTESTTAETTAIASSETTAAETVTETSTNTEKTQTTAVKTTAASTASASQKINGKAAETVAKVYTLGEYYYAGEGTIGVYADINKESSRIAELSNGNIVSIISTDGNAGCVRIKGMTAFVNMNDMTFAGEGKKQEKGDINGDGSVNAVDLAIINDYLSNMEILPEGVSILKKCEADAADINDDGLVDNTDVLFYLMLICN